jgi:hypothetical protein
MIRDRLGGRVFASLAIFSALLVAMTAPAAAAGGAVNWDAETAPEGAVEVDMTKAQHNMAWGQSADSVRIYEGDNGEQTKVDAEINTTGNPYTFLYSNLNVTDWSNFPRSTSASAIDAAEWSKDVSGSTGTATIASTTTAPGVDGVQLSTSGQASGDVAKFTFSNFTIDSDEAKRYAQAVYNANSVDSGATYELRYVDADGDYKTVISNSTVADGIVEQEQLGNLATEGSGDGTFNDIEKIQVVVLDADADLTFVGLNGEKKSAYDLGEQRVDTDSDGSLDDTVDVGEDYAGGQVSLTGLDTLGETFDDAEIYELTVPVEFTGELADRTELEQTEDESTDGGNYPGYKGTSTIYVAFELPDAYDLSFSGAELVDTQAVTSDRLLSVEYAEGVGDTEFGNISDSTWSDMSGSYSGEGSTVTVDSTIQVGSVNVLQWTYKLTPDQFDDLGATAGGGGSGAMGVAGANIPILGGIIAAAVAFLKRLGS